MRRKAVMKKWKYYFGLLLCLIIFIFSFYAKNSISASETKVSFRYDKTKTTLLIGEKYRIKVVGKNLTVKWKSSDKSVATVSKNGSIIGKKQGTVKIKAVVRGKKINTTFTAEFTVLDKTVLEDFIDKNLVRIQDTIKELRETYPEGTRWGNDKEYYCEANYITGYGCVSLVFQFSDKLFGKKALFKEFDDFTNIENEINIGDIIRLNGDSHSVMVIDKNEGGVTIVEGNYNGAVHWDRYISYEELKQIGNYYSTRYPR